ncbi:MAG TPA: hypothetical protein VI033_01455 [Candidatus Nitrosopolaris sp.]|jgi:hypothetical protein
MDKTKKILTIATVIATTAVLLLPSVLSNPVLAQSIGQGSSSARKDYKDFQNCLSDAEGTKGYVTEQEIRGCFNPIYNTGTSPSGGDTGSSSGGNNDNNPSSSDTNSPGN